jgi:hypothetical protein
MRSVPDPGRAVRATAGATAALVALVALVATTTFAATWRLAPSGAAGARFTRVVSVAGPVAATGKPTAVPSMTAQACAVTVIPLGLVPKVTVTWSAATFTGLSGYAIRRGTSTIATLSTADHSYVDNGAALNTTYTYEVRALMGTAQKWYAGRSVTVTVPLLLGCNTASSP